MPESTKAEAETPEAATEESEAAPKTTVKFSDLGLSSSILAAIEEAGFTTPTEIQAQAIPIALSNRDVLGIAQTGTGKTAAFVLPLLARLEKGRARARMPRSLIMTPTRELANQIAQDFAVLGKNHKLNIAILIGGVSFEEQNKILDRGADVVIATPGRLLDHFGRGKLLLNAVEALVIDEADRMLDMGFVPDIEKICKLLPFTRQTLFFSATMAPEIKRLVDSFLHNPATVRVARSNSTAKTITQRFIKTSTDFKEKRDILRTLIKESKELQNAIIFCNRKRDLSILYRSLSKHGFNVGSLHGDMDQYSRTKTLAGFKNGDITILAASDVAARGLDIPEVSHVFNFDVPNNAEDYVHRIGRTGRAGRKGTAITLVTPKDMVSLKAIEKLCLKEVIWMDEINPNQKGRNQPKDKDASSSKTSESKPSQNKPNKHQKTSTQEQSKEEPNNTKKAEPQNKNNRNQNKKSQNQNQNSNQNNNSSNAVVGMGEHTPAFMTRSVRPAR